MKSGGVLIADKQEAGRGRRGNHWFSSSEKSLTFSLLIKNNDKLLNKKISLICGISIAKAIKDISGVDCGLKWPNDVVHDSKKIAGVLIEQKQNHFIIGMGVNVNNTNFPKSIQDKACSLELILDYPTQREELLAKILNHLEKLLFNDLADIIMEWESLCSHMGIYVKFHDYNNIVNGKFIGLSRNGDAKIDINGEEVLFNSGIVEL
jgi:BirA family biotin operon repressor/biotin-[acetyl-CoA-carboxylase] ligase